MNKLTNCLNIPENVLTNIRENCADREEQQRVEVIHYYRKYSPGSLLTWNFLSGRLQFCGEDTAAKESISRYTLRTIAPGLCDY